MAEQPERRRRRPAVSCNLCRRRKIRCNREAPCSNCIKSGVTSCVYESHPSSPLPARQPQQLPAPPLLPSLTFAHPASTPRPSSVSIASSTIPSHPSSSVGKPTKSSVTTASTLSWLCDVESIRSKIRQLEEQLPKAAAPPATLAPTPNPAINTTTSRLGGTFHIQIASRSVTHKTRLFGQTHWINVVSLFQDACEMVEPHLLEEEPCKALAEIQRCKNLARVVKASLTPEWPCSPTPDLPPKDVADELVDCYLRTSETLYRILHIPIFRRDYEALWVSEAARADASFLVLLKLVLAIGATVYDEHFSLRASAIRWVYEAHTWLLEPKLKSRLGIRSLQIYLLLLVAREAVGISEESVWISAGALLRRAMYMGLHRDPAHLPKRTALASEIRRRLWNTVLEITVQSSLASGGPPLLSLDDFDTEPPSNFDDEQLATEDPAAKPDAEFTQVAVARALRKTLPIRLAVIKFLNRAGPAGTYDETLRLDTELRASFKDLRRDLQTLSSRRGQSNHFFDVLAVDFLLHRYLLSLHIPFFGLSLSEPAYAFSRSIVTETSLKIWYAACPSPSLLRSGRSGDRDGSRNASPAPSGMEDMARFVSCGSGLFRTVAMQAALLLVIELRAHIQEEESLGPVPLRPDLLSVVDDAKVWCLRCIEAGETNIKGFLLMSVVAAQIQGLRQGLRGDDLARLMVRAAEDTGDKCIPMLEQLAAASQSGRGEDRSRQASSSDVPPEAVEDWDFIMTDAEFSYDNLDLMGWLLNNDVGQQPEF